MKIYKHYFEQPFAVNTKVLWLRLAYPNGFIKHKVLKIKLFGIFTIYKAD